MGKFLFSLSVIILTHCSQNSSQNNNKDNKSTPPKFNNNRILNDIDKILDKNESLNKIVKDWDEQIKRDNNIRDNIENNYKSSS